CIDDEGKWVEFQGLFDLRDGFLISALFVQELAIPLMGRRITRIELDGTSQLPFCSCPVPIKVPFHGRQRGVCFGESLVHFQGSRRRLPRFRVGLFSWQET